MTEASGVGNLQTLKLAARATSKYKVLEPTKVSDLLKYRPENFKAPNEEELDNLTEGDLVQISFINREDLWVVVDSADGDAQRGTVYGKTCQQTMKVHGLQKGQRVCFDIQCVSKIQYHDSDDEHDDEEDSDDDSEEE